MISLLKLTENDKRILIVVFLAIIIIFLFIGLIVSIIKRIMQRRGKAVDNYMYNIVRAKLVSKPREFRKIALRKNFIMFYKKIRIPFLILILFVIAISQYMIIKGTTDVSFLFSKKGFGSLFFSWDWQDVEKSRIFGITTFLPAEWPKLSNKPTFLSTYEAITSYVAVPLLIIGLILYLHHLVGFIARNNRARKLSKSVFQKNLENV